MFGRCKLWEYVEIDFCKMVLVCWLGVVFKLLSLPLNDRYRVLRVVWVYLEYTVDMWTCIIISTYVCIHVAIIIIICLPSIWLMLSFITLPDEKNMCVAKKKDRCGLFNFYCYCFHLYNLFIFFFSSFSFSYPPCIQYV